MNEQVGNFEVEVLSVPSTQPLAPPSRTPPKPHSDPSSPPWRPSRIPRRNTCAPPSTEHLRPLPKFA